MWLNIIKITNTNVVIFIPPAVEAGPPPINIKNPHTKFV